jgi:hypothetical protein
MATGFGADTFCDHNGLRPGRLARGNQLLAQALLRRIRTPRGVLRGGEEESNYGLDVVGYVGSVGPQLAARALPAVIRTEWLKDDRVADVAITGTVTENQDGTSDVFLACVVQPSDSTDTFPLSLRVSDVTLTDISSP